MLLLEAVSLPILSALTGASIRAVLLAAIAALLLCAVRTRSAPLQHAVWTVVTISMLLLPCATSVLPPLRTPQVIEPAGWAGPVSALMRAGSAPQRVHRAEPIIIQIDSSSKMTSRITPLIRPGVAWPGLVIAVYIAGLVTILLRVWIGLFLSGRLLAQSSTLHDARANTLLEEAAREQQLSFPWPRLYESPAVAVPVVVPGQDSSILLPVDWRHWDDWKLRAVLAHELTHTRRRDSLVMLVAALNKAVFWFHPLAWWLEKRLSSLCEQASDDAAVTATGDPVRYARVVLDLAERAGTARGRLLPNPAAGLSMATSSNVSRRIHRLLEINRWSAGVITPRSWLSLTLAAVPLVALMAAAQAPQSPSPGKPTGDVPPAWQWQSEGFSTTAEEARALEERLTREPEDLAARAKLIAYYVYNANPAVRPHATWVIEHHPESELAASAPVNAWYLVGPTAPGVLGQRPMENIQLWRRQAALHYQDARVLGNAALALMMADPPEAERLLRRARELDPGEEKWLRHLTRLYAEAVSTDCYRRFGVAPFNWMHRVDPAFLTHVRQELDGSRDMNLIGGVGSVLAYLVAHTFVTRAGQDAQIAQARHSISEYALLLLNRALADHPSRAEWVNALGMLNRPSAPANTGGALPPPSAAPSTAAGEAATALQVPAAQQSQLLTASTPPEYPPLARQARIQGTVRFRIRIGTDGRVRSLALVNGHPLLVASATHSLRTHVYRPTLVNGQPVEVETTVDVNFILSGKE